MKILWFNYLKDSTVTASSVDTLFPVENLTDVFLEFKYQAQANQSLITIEFPEDRTVSMIAYGYHNLIEGAGTVISNTYGAADVISNTYGADTVYSSSLSGGYKLKNSSGATLLSGQLVVDDDVSITYVDATVCRSIELFFTATDTLYIGGLAVGDPLEYPRIMADTDLEDLLRDDSEKTNGGQVIGEQIPMLRQWRVSIPDPDMTNAKRLETREMLKAVGTYQPVFADLWEEDDSEPPMYGNFMASDSYSRNPYDKTYGFGFTLEEAN